MNNNYIAQNKQATVVGILHPIAEGIVEIHPPISQRYEFIIASGSHDEAVSKIEGNKRFYIASSLLIAGIGLGIKIYKIFRK